MASSSLLSVGYGPGAGTHYSSMEAGEHQMDKYLRLGENYSYGRCSLFTQLPQKFETDVGTSYKFHKMFHKMLPIGLN